MAALCPTSRAALNTCSRQLRKVVHNFTTALCIQSFRDAVSIAKGDWPQLCLIILPDQTRLASYMACPGYSGSAGTSVPCTDFCTCYSPDCRPKDRPAAQTELDSSSKQTICQSVLLLATTPLAPSQHTFTNSICAADVATLIAAADWPNLSELHISTPNISSSGSIGAALVGCLGKRKKCLHLSCNHLDVVAVKQLVQGKWPLLERLYLKPG